VRNAARAYRNALATVPSGATVAPTVSAEVERARAAVNADNAALSCALERHLEPIRQRHGGGTFRRVERCVELLTSQRRRYMPEPTFMYFPEIPAVEFFERGQFPWLDAIEAVTDDIREELSAVLVSDRAGLEPYIAYPDGIPLDQWRELNKSRRWSAYFLWNQGAAQLGHQARCPRTVQALQGAPQCDVAGHGPTAFFSILDAGTNIPPHTGVTNTRLTVHLPLIVPPDCSFRVGSETREWIPGKAWVFDDTIEHEAWNRSDAPRAVLIFDVWNPFLSEAERDLVRATTEFFSAYYGPTAGGTA
jgi:aspartyl/asparaginyl beta-hydroxylase (cupin superfamily)